MTDFGSIYQMANHPTVALENPMDAMGKMMSLKNLATQNQMGDMQVQQQQQALQDAQELRSTIQKSVQSGQSPVQAVSQLASPAAQGWAKQYTEMASAQTKLSKEQFDLSEAHLKKVGGDVVGATQAPGVTRDQVAAVIARHAQDRNIPPDKAQALIQSIPTDPAAIPTWGLTQGITLGASKDLLGLFVGDTHMVDTGTGTQPVVVNKVTKTVQNVGPEIEKNIGPGDLKKFASDIGALKDDGSIDMTNPQVKAKIHAMTTNMATVIQGAGGSGGASFDPSIPLGPADESQARYAAQTGARETPSMRNPGALQRNARAEFLAQQGGGDIAGNKIQFKNQQDANKFFTTGKGADAMRQQETIIHHADAFLQMATALDNGDVQLANKFANQLGVQLGNDKAKNVELAGHILSEEVGKYLSGSSGSAEEREKMGQLLPAFSSPQQFRGAVTTLQTMVQGQRQSWQQQRAAALAGQVPFQQGGGQQAPHQAAPVAPTVPNLSNFHTNHTTGQRIGQNASGAWVDAATGKPVQ